MKVNIEVHGHQYYTSTIGNILQHTHSVEMFPAQGDSDYPQIAMQVPAILLETDEGSIQLITLKRWLYDVIINRVEEKCNVL